MLAAMPTRRAVAVRLKVARARSTLADGRALCRSLPGSPSNRWSACAAGSKPRRPGRSGPASFFMMKLPARDPLITGHEIGHDEGRTLAGAAGDDQVPPRHALGAQMTGASST